MKNIQWLMLLFLAVIFSATINAATLTVNSTDDNTDSSCDATHCSLREAVLFAVPDDVIDFTVTGTIILVNGVINLDKNLLIQGPGSSQLTLDGNGNTKIFWINNTSATVSINGLTLTNGNHVNGGAIDNATAGGGNLTLVDCVLSNNTSSGDGGAIANNGQLTLSGSTLVGNSSAGAGGAIFNSGTLTINSSTLQNNVSTLSSGFSGGGAIRNLGTLVITGSSLSNNTALIGGAINNSGSLSIDGGSGVSSNHATDTSVGGGGIFSQGDLSISINNSTLEGNTATYKGGGLLIWSGTAATQHFIYSSQIHSNIAKSGGGIATEGSLVTLTIQNSSVLANESNGGVGYGGGGLINRLGTVAVSNSTFSGNLSAFTGGAIENIGTLDVNNSTIASNSSTGYGGGVYSENFVNMGNSLIAGNTAPTGSEIEIASGSFTSQGHNLFGVNGDPGLSGATPIASDIVPSVPLALIISPFTGDNGGNTQTRPPVVGSPALDAGDNALILPGVTVDQRGLGFPRILNGIVDIGAVEGTVSYYIVTATVASGSGTISPLTQPVNPNDTATFTVTPSAGYIATVSGCGGTLSGATYTTGPITADCTVTASFTYDYTPPPPSDITITAIAENSGGTISPDTQIVVYGNATTFTVTPEVGYTAAVTGCGGTLIGTTYTTQPITSICTAIAHFTVNTYAVTVSSSANGTISPATALVDHGQTATFTVAPDAGYTATVTGCGGTLVGNLYTTGSITAACTVSATFSQKSYPVNAIAGTHGTITPATQDVLHGETATLTITPDTGYTAAVTGCDGTLSDNLYTTGSVTAACTVSATFSQKSYPVGATAGTNGTITPATQEVPHGGRATFTVTPNPRYTATVTGCGGVLSDNLYTTEPITAPCAVSAIFKSTVNAYTVTVSAGPNGIISPAAQKVNQDATAAFTIIPTTGYTARVAGCNGDLVENLYITGAISENCTIFVDFQPLPTKEVPTLLTATVPNAVIGIPYGALLTASGGQPPFTYTATGLPPGLSLTVDGALGGTPTVIGEFTLTATVTDRQGKSSDRHYRMGVAPELTLATTTLPDGLINAPYAQTLQALGGRSPYTFRAVGLPNGLSLSADGLLAGTPTQTGDAAIQITVEDSQGYTVTQSTLLTLRDIAFTRPDPAEPAQIIQGALTTPADVTCTLNDQQTFTLNLGDPGAPGTGPDGITLPDGLLRIVAEGCTAGGVTLTVTLAYPYPLPPGADYWKYGPTLDDPTDHWYALPGAQVTGNTVTFLLMDGGIGDADLTANAIIRDPGGRGVPNLRIGGSTGTTSPQSKPYRASLKASYGGTTQAVYPLATDADAAYVWSVAEGVLPPGLTLEGTTEEATLSGVPEEPGIYSFTLQVIDRLHGRIMTQQDYTLEILPLEPVAALTANYYEVILGRAPDEAGLAYWNSEVERMQALGVDVQEVFRVMAGQFFTSAEYLDRQTSNAEYVNDLYAAFFSRVPDNAGLSYWTGQLTAGLPRDVAMYSFLFSREYTETLQELFGDTATRAEINMVVDFYRGLLNRLSDDAGFTYWRDRFRAAQCQEATAVTAAADEISRLFANSSEYRSRARLNREYVADLYYAFMRRGAELDGFNAWVNQLNDGLSRESLRQIFVATPEFQGRVQQVISAGCLK